MTKYIRYQGEFVARDNTSWMVRILQEADNAFDYMEDLIFPGTEPLVIEWDDTGKEDCVQGSTATLQIVSPGDRTYIDLYTEDPTAIRLDVYRGIDTIEPDGYIFTRYSLYWQGCLDPEFYEEPYSTGKDYEVSLTFSDFGVLDRQIWDAKGAVLGGRLILNALVAAGLSYETFDQSLITTQTTSYGSPLSLDDITIRADNFYDEDGEPNTLLEVVEAVLQPLGLHLVQRFGQVWIYDLNGVYNKAETAVIEWSDTDQTLGVDRVFNNIIITWSPYDKGSLGSSDDVVYTLLYDIDHYSVASSPAGAAGYGLYTSYYPSYSEDYRVDGEWDYNLIDFTFFASDSRTEGGVGLAEVGQSCRYFHILPVTGTADECTGVAYHVMTGGHGSIIDHPDWAQSFTGLHKSVSDVDTSNWETVFRTEKKFLPGLGSLADDIRLKVALQVCIDGRYNPFSGEESDNDNTNDKYIKNRAAWVFIPAKITVYDDDGNALYHYRNRDTAEGAEQGSIGYLLRVKNHYGRWVSGADAGGDCWLEYYSNDIVNDNDATGLSSWAANRQCIGRPDGTSGRIKPQIFTSFAQLDDGEYLPYPPVGGWLEVEIGGGIRGFDYGESGEFSDGAVVWNTKNNNVTIYDRFRWVLYKGPDIALVDTSIILKELDTADYEYSAVANAGAKEDLELDTMCGTAAGGVPAARGAYFNTSTGDQITALYRAGRETQVEELLIGTLYSQFAERKTKLSGTAALASTGVCRWTDEALGEGVYLMMTGAVEDIQASEMECTWIEVRPDEYDKE